MAHAKGYGESGTKKAALQKFRRFMIDKFVSYLRNSQVCVKMLSDYGLGSFAINKTDTPSSFKLDFTFSLVVDP